MPSWSPGSTMVLGDRWVEERRAGVAVIRTPPKAARDRKVVMRGLVPRIRAFVSCWQSWMAGTEAGHDESGNPFLRFR